MGDFLGSTCLHPGLVMNIPRIGSVFVVGLTVSCTFSKGRFVLAPSFTTFSLSLRDFVAYVSNECSKDFELKHVIIRHFCKLPVNWL